MATGLVNTIADFATTLASGVAVGATTATLTSATDSDGVALPSGTYGFTIDRKNSAKEYIECSLSGTALTSIKTIARGTGVGTSGFARAHRKGAEVIISDYVAIKRLDDVLTTGYAGATTPTTDYQLATKKYVDDVSIAGASNATTTTQGLVELGTQAQIDAGTATGETGASLVSTPATTRAKKYHDYAADAGANDAYAITITPAITAYAEGQEFTFEANTANTGPATLAVSGLSAIPILKKGTIPLVTGDILAGQIVKVVYDATGNFQLVSNYDSAPVVTTYDVSGSPHTWTKPVGLKYIDVECWGGGGSGGSTTSNLSGGGGGGSYATRRIMASSLGTTETVTIGAGGAAATSNNNGNVGGNTTFGSLLTAYGGGGGGGNSDGSGGGGAGISAVGATASTATAGAGGAPVGGAAGSTSAGGAGQFGGGGGGDAGGIGGVSVYGGGGGGGGNAGVAGGSSVYGGGGGGNSVSGGGASTFGGAGGGLGEVGVVPGGGGGGGSSTAGGAGGAGRCKVTEYY